jgi:RimK family alpha-L-glutamate ligase
MSGSLTIGVLSLHSSKETKAILNAIDDLGHETAWLRAENTTVDITDGTVTLEPDVDMVVNRLLLSKEEQPAEALGLATMLDRIRPMLNTPTATMTAIHKFATGTALAEAGVPVPDALMALSGDVLNARRDHFGEEVVYKTAIGTHGGGSWQVHLDKPVNPQVGERQAFLQEFVDQPGTQRDLRVYLVGGDIVGAMYRYAPDGDWRTNVSLGGRVEDATGAVPRDAAETATRAADVLGLDYAGVDLISNSEGWYVLEVNPTAGFRGLFEATGHSPAPYIASLAAEHLGVPVDDEEVEALAGELDDSRPDCVAQRRPDANVEPSVIGYVEEVTVSGTRGTETVYAKSDTGAERSSIDLQLAADIGTGPITNVVRVRSGSDKASRTRPVVDIVVGVGGQQYTVSASVEDREHMQYPLLLGRDILGSYQVDVGRRADRPAGSRDVEE